MAEKKVRQRHVPFGYQIRNGLAEVVEEEAEIVRTVFCDYLAGMPTYKIARRLSEQGIPNANGEPSWHHGGVGKLLDNEKYCGDEFYPLIVPHGQFELVKQRRKERMEQLGRNKNPDGNSDGQMFKGKVFCGICGHEYRTYAKNHKKPGTEGRHWKCSKHIQRTYGVCGNIALEETQIRNAAISAIRHARKKTMYTRDAIQNLQKSEPLECRRLTERIDMLLSTGHFSVEEIKQLLYERARIQYRTLEIPYRQYRAEQMWDYLNKHGISEEIDEEAIRCVIDRIIVEKNGNLDVHMMDGSVVIIDSSTGEGRMRDGKPGKKEHIHYSGQASL